MLTAAQDMTNGSHMQVSWTAWSDVMYSTIKVVLPDGIVEALTV